MKKKPILVSEEVHNEIKREAEKSGTTMDNVLRSKLGLEIKPLSMGVKPYKD